MAELKVGLAPNRTSYYDKITNTYITLEKPVVDIVYDENDMPGTVKRLEKICHALFASVPALRLYEGKVPEECIEHWKNKYMKPFNSPMGQLVRNLSGNIVPPTNEPNRAFDRPELVNEKSADNNVVAASVENAEKVEIKAEVNVEKEEVPTEKEEDTTKEVKEAKQEEPEAETTTKKTTTRKKASTKKKTDE